MGSAPPCEAHCDLSVCESDELRDIDLVGASGFRVGDVGEPFQLGRYVGEIAVLCRCQRPSLLN